MTCSFIQQIVLKHKPVMVGTREPKKHGVFPVSKEPTKGGRYVNRESRT